MKRTITKDFVITALALMISLALVGVALAQGSASKEEPSATIEIKKWKVGFIVGIGGGKGTLHYKGKSYPVSIGGLRVGATVGMAEADLAGNVYNLKKLEDIEGVYTAGQAAISLVGGKKVWMLENAKGVLLKLSGKQTGIELAVDVGGMKISLK